MRRLVAALVTLTMLLASAARAEADEHADRRAARALAREGIERFDQGDYEAALLLFEQAEARFAAATMGLMAARSLERLGRLVEASERYRAVMRAPIAPNASAALRSAPAKAARERAALVRRIPSLELHVEGDARVRALTLDGVPFREELLGAPQPLDPGAHELRWHDGDRSRVQRVVLLEGERRRMLIGAHMPAPAPPTAPDGIGARDAIAAAALGVGAAAVVASAATGIAVLVEQDALDEQGCAEQLCPAALAGEVEHYNELRWASGTTLVSGLALGGAGAALLVSARPERGAASFRLRWAW